ncbi:MAG: hypothetical protein OXI49_18165 [Acidobacteriota bacterium]|nr:hypothetical protein [Acidobacteriota bacterium]
MTIYMKDIHHHHAEAFDGLRKGSYEAYLVGNWFEAFAALTTSKLASRKIVRHSGLEEQMREFWNEAVAAHTKGGPLDPHEKWPDLGRLVG